MGDSVIIVYTSVGPVAGKSILSNLQPINQFGPILVYSGAMADGIISGNHLVSGSIGADHILAGSIYATHIVSNAIESHHISAESITAFHISGNTITGDKIVAGAISGGHIAAETITAGKIAVEAIESRHIATNSILAQHIAVNTILAEHINSNQIYGYHIVGAQISGNHIAAGEITAQHIQVGTITADSAIIASGAITSALIADASITSAKIQTAAIVGAHIKDASILTAHILDAQITGAKIATAQIDTAHLKDGIITNAKIATAAIGSGNIQYAAIHEGHIADATITDAKIVNLSAGKITSGILNADRIAAGSITGDKIAVNTITASHIQAGTINSTHIAASGLSSSLIRGGVIDLETGIIVRASGGGTIITGQGIDASFITTGHLDASKITVSNLLADSIIAGSLTLAGINLVKNSSFETQDPALLVGSAQFSTDYTYDGLYSVKWDGADINSGLKVTFIPQGALNYIASIYINNPNNLSGNIICYLSSTDREGQVYRTNLDLGAFFIPAYSNKRYFWVFVGDVSEQQISLTFKISGFSGSGYVYADCIMVQRGNIASEWVLHPDEQLSPGVITEDLLADSSVTDRKIANLTADKITAGQLNTQLVAITDGLGATVIHGGKMYTEHITIVGPDGTTVIDSQGINASQITVGELDASLIKSGTITADKFQSTLYGNINDTIQYVQSRMGEPVLIAPLSECYASGVATQVFYHEKIDALTLLCVNYIDEEPPLVSDSPGIYWDVPVYPSGSWVSPVFDLGSIYDAGLIDVEHVAVVPLEATRYRIYSRYAMDGPPTGDWQESMSTIANNIRYFQVKIDITTTDDMQVLVLGNVRIAFKISWYDEVHANIIPIDHPDGSITTSKVADGAITPVKLDRMYVPMLSGTSLPSVSGNAEGTLFLLAGNPSKLYALLKNSVYDLEWVQLAVAT